MNEQKIKLDLNVNVKPAEPEESSGSAKVWVISLSAIVVLEAGWLLFRLLTR
jgi:hypothetical protein